MTGETERKTVCVIEDPDRGETLLVLTDGDETGVFWAEHLDLLDDAKVDADVRRVQLRRDDEGKPHGVCEVDGRPHYGSLLLGNLTLPAVKEHAYRKVELKRD